MRRKPARRHRGRFGGGRSVADVTRRDVRRGAGGPEVYPSGTKGITLGMWGNGLMIKNFKHKGLRLLYEDGNRKGISPEHMRKVRQILAVLNVALTIDALRLPTFDLHALKGDRQGIWSVKVQGNWRLTFRFEDGEASDINYEDYHEGHH
jgi:proteic killer suppression protein